MNDDAMLHDAKLQELAHRLGAAAADRLDVERTAAAVVARLRERPQATASAWLSMQPAWVKIAAVLVVVAGAGLVTRSVLRVPGGPRATIVAVPLAEDLNDLTAEQLRETKSSLEQPLIDESTGVLDTGLEGLSAEELRALLRTLEG